MIHTYTRSCIHVKHSYTYICISTYKLINLHTLKIYTCIHTYYTCIHIRAYSHTHTYIHMYAHKHTQLQLT